MNQEKNNIKEKNFNNYQFNKKRRKTQLPMINAILDIIEKIEKEINKKSKIKCITVEKKSSPSKYDFILNFSSFFKFINDKKCLIQNFCENKDIKLDINIYYSLCIKGNNFELQTKFINEFNKLNLDIKKYELDKLYLQYSQIDNEYNLLMINYEESNNIYILNNDDKELLQNNYSINEVLENKKIRLNFLNSFLDNFSDLYIIFLDENYEKNNEKLIEETIKTDNSEKYLVIHSFQKKNKNKIYLQLENNNKYRKVPIINEIYEEIEKDTKTSYYYIENGKEITHFIYIQDEPNENKELFDVLNGKLATKTIIRPTNFNFKNEYITFFKNYLSQIFNNIEINYNDNNNKNIEINLISVPTKKEIISSELIFPPEQSKLKYSFMKNENSGKIYFNIETDSKAKQFSGNILQYDDLNIVRLTIKYDDQDKKNNPIFSNKVRDMKENEEIKINHDYAIIYDGYMNKNKNNIKNENGILSFENEITMNLNRTFEIFDFNLDE